MTAVALAPPQPSCAQILDLLEAARHRGPDWLFLRELRTHTGLGYDTKYIDAFAMHLWPSRGHARTAYEVKVSRSDFLREIKDPKKRRQALLYANQFYFVAPAGLLAVAEIPPEAGLLEVDVGTAVPFVLRCPLPAPVRDTAMPTWALMASLVRKVRDEKGARR